MADPTGQIDISLALIGAESAGAVDRLIARMQDLDNRLKSIAMDTPDQGNFAATLKQQSDRSRGVVQTGSTTLADPMRVRYSSPGSYNFESARNVSPVSNNQQNARERVAAADDESRRYRTVTDDNGRRSARLIPKATDYVQGESVPGWLQNMEKRQRLGALDEPVRMPRYGEYTAQDKLDLAAQVASQKALKRYQRHETQVRQDAINSANQEGGLTAEEITQRGQAAVAELSQSKDSAGSGLGKVATAASALAGAAAMGGVVSPYIQGFGQHVTGNSGLRDVTAYDATILHPWHSIRHAPTTVRALQAMGQQSGYGAGSQDLHIPGFFGLTGGRQAQEFWKGATTPAGREGINIASDIRAYNREFSRVSPNSIAQFESDIVNEGYHGQQRSTMSHVAAGLMQNTGVDPTILAPFMGDAMRYGNSNLKDFASLINETGAAAQRAGMSVNAYNEGLHKYAQNAVDTQGAASIVQAARQAKDITSAYGINTTQAGEVANNPMVQNFAMLQSGVLPGMQGNLPGAAFGQASQSMLRMYGNAAASFAHSSTTHTQFGDITTSAQENQYAAMSKMTGMPVSLIRRLMDPKNNIRDDAQSTLTAYLHPNEGNRVGSNFDPRQVLEQVRNTGLLGHGKQGAFNYNYLSKIRDPHELARQLQGAISPHTPDSKGSGLGGTELTISLEDDIKRYFNLKLGNQKGKTTKWDPASVIARAGGQAAAGVGIDPIVAANARRGIGAADNAH